MTFYIKDTKTQANVQTPSRDKAIEFISFNTAIHYLNTLTKLDPANTYTIVSRG